MTLSQRFDLILVRRSDLERYIDDLIEQCVQDRVEDRVERHVERYVRRYVGSTIAGIEGRIRTLTGEMTILGERMTSNEQAEQGRWDEVGRVAGLVLAELASLKSQVDAAVADKEAAVAAGVSSALGEEAAADIARLDNLITQLTGALPVSVPDVPEPAPGEPATDPETGQTSDDVVSEGVAPVGEAPAPEGVAPGEEAPAPEGGSVQGSG